MRLRLLRPFARRLRELQAAPVVGRLDAALLFLLGCYWLLRELRRSPTRRAGRA